MTTQDADTMAKAAEKDLSTSKVMLFHDQRRHVKHLVSILRFAGLKDITVSDQLGDAIQKIISTRFDLIVVTHFGEAPKPSRLIEELKGHDATADIPILAVSAGKTIKHFLRILAKGVDEVLVEPVTQEEVQNKINKLLGDREWGERGRDELEQAERLMAEGDLKSAERSLLGVLSQKDLMGLDEDLIVLAHLDLAQVYALNQDYKGADLYLKKGLELAKATPDKIRLHQLLALVFHYYGLYYEIRKNLQKAMKSYRTAFQLNPFYLKNMLGLFNLLQQGDELEEMIKLVAECTANFLPFSQPMETIAVSIADMCRRFEKLGLDEHADRLYRELVQMRHEDADVHIMVGEHFKKIGELGQVVANLLRVNERIKDPDLLYMLGTLLLENAGFEVEEEIERYSAENAKVIDEMPGQDKALAMAKQAFHQAMLLETDEPRHRMGLASCELRLGNLAAAGQVLAKIKEGDLATLDTYVEVIRGLITEKAWELGHQWLKEAAAKYPESPEIARLFAEYFLERNKPYEAITALKKGLVHAPDDGEMLLLLAETYIQTGEQSEAVFYFEKAGQFLPDDDRVKEGIRRALSRKAGGRSS